MFTPFPPDLSQLERQPPPRTMQRDPHAEPNPSSSHSRNLKPTGRRAPKPPALGGQQHSHPTFLGLDDRDGGGGGDDDLNHSSSRLTLASQLSRVSGGSTETTTSSSTARSSSSNKHYPSLSFPFQARRLSLPATAQESHSSLLTGSKPSRSPQPTTPSPPHLKPTGRGGSGNSSQLMASSLSMALHGVKSKSRPGTPKDAVAATGSQSSVSKESADPQGSGRPVTATGRSKKLRSTSRPNFHAPSLYHQQRSTPTSSPHPDGGEASTSGTFSGSDPPSYDRRTSWESLNGRSIGDSSRSTAVWANLNPAYSDDQEAITERTSSDLRRQPLPVRLGLVPAFPTNVGDGAPRTTGAERRPAPHRYRGPPGVAGARYTDGYYLHVPPPKLRLRQKNTSEQTVPSLASETSVHSQLSSLSSGTASPQNESGEQFPAHPSRLRRASSGRRPGPHILQPRTRPKASSDPHRQTDDDLTARMPSSSDASLHHSEHDQWELGDYWEEQEYATETGARRKTRRHAFPRQEVPYFLSHDLEAINSEIDLHNMAYEVLSQRLSIYPFGEEKPARVLDIGTGSGAWCIDLAKRWPKTEVVGLDVVPCQTPTRYLKDADLESRISWVVANFLEELPFPSASFDMVHVRFIGSCAMREDHWSDLLAEIARVLKPSGQIEFIESNWNFLGNVQLMPASELIRMTTGKSAPRSHLPQKPVDQPPKKYEAIEDAFERVLGRRFINPKVTSVIPNALMNADLRDIQTGVPRILPVIANAADQEGLCALRDQSRKDGSPASAASPSSPVVGGDTNEEDWKNRFVTRSQIGAPLKNSGFAPRDLPMVRALLLSGLSGRLWSSRHLLWQEAEEEKLSLLAQSVGPQGNGRLNRSSSACWAHPWRNVSDFTRDISSYRREMLHRAEIGNLLKGVLGWTEGTPESIEESRVAEKKRKMSIGIKTSLGIDVDLNYPSDGQATSSRLNNPSHHTSPAESSPLSRRFSTDSELNGTLDSSLDRSESEQGQHSAPAQPLVVSLDSGSGDDASMPGFKNRRRGESESASAASPAPASVVPTSSPALELRPASNPSLRTAYSKGTSSGVDSNSFTGTGMTTPSSTATSSVPPSLHIEPSRRQPSVSPSHTRASTPSSGPSRSGAQSRSPSHSSPRNGKATLDSNAREREYFEMLGFAEFAGYLAKVPAGG